MGLIQWLFGGNKKQEPKTEFPFKEIAESNRRIAMNRRPTYMRPVSGGTSNVQPNNAQRSASVMDDLTNPLNPLSPFFIGNNDDYLPSQNDYPAASPESDAPNDFGGGNFDGGGAGGSWDDNTQSSSPDISSPDVSSPGVD